jgi:enoyl-[acyl-carrier-protein] reductase (NADH)
LRCGHTFPRSPLASGITGEVLFADRGSNVLGVPPPDRSALKQ